MKPSRVTPGLLFPKNSLPTDSEQIMNPESMYKL